MTASTGICFIGFNLTSSELQDALKFGFFLAAEVIQIASICYYGDSIVVAVSIFSLNLLQNIKNQLSDDISLHIPN